jgi:hypothetical protein
LDEIMGVKKEAERLKNVENVNILIAVGKYS